MDPAKRKLYIIAASSFIALLAAVYFLFIFQKKPKAPKPGETTGEVQQLADIELAKRPHITMTPTADGAEIIISIENMANFDRIDYELTYLADNPQALGEKITRGATGTDVNTRDDKYKKSILLGTASRGVRSPDKGIADGKLAMHLFKDDTEYLSETNWDLLEVSASTQVLKDRTGNLQIENLSLGKNYWVIIADTVGLPEGQKEFDHKNVIGPNYGIFSIAPEFVKPADLSITLSANPTQAFLYSFSNRDSSWKKVESSYDPSNKTISAKVNSLAAFVVTSQ